MKASTDVIEKRVLLGAPIERVWRAIGDSAEFGKWFGARFEGPFTAGARVRATIQPTTVDPAIAKSQEPYAGAAFDVWIERVEPPRHLSFRWHPGAESVDADARAASRAGTTLVTFDLDESEGGTLLTIRESGFEAVPLERRARAFEQNEEGWAMQSDLIRNYLSRAA